MIRRAALACAAALTLAASVGACGSEGAGSSSAGTAAAIDSARARDDRIVEELRRFEAERRAAADFGSAPPSDRLFGPDPYAVRAVSGGRFVGLLRGTDALVLLDAELREIARTDAPASASGLAVSEDTAFVVGERDDRVHIVPVVDGGFGPARTFPIALQRAMRDVAVGPGGVLHVVEEDRSTLFTLLPRGPSGAGYDVASVTVPAGPFRVARIPSAVLVASLLAHTVSAYRVDAQGRPAGPPAVIANDGPLWSFAAHQEDDGRILVASGGVEDKPLDRTHGSFENIDSFVYLDALSWTPEPRVTRLAEINVSEHGVVVPKALDLQPDGDAFRITVTGFGGGALATLRVPKDGAAPTVTTRPLPPGTAAFTRDRDDSLVIANPLLDAWVRLRAGDPPQVVPVPDPRRADRAPASRLGEALIFTTLIAPWNRSAGPLSRFTCETCHFEGYGDGRTHATGRGDVRATTRPLLGLFNNRPHFSRALDPDLSIVAHSEFRVAGARSDHDPVFDLPPDAAPWLAHLGVSAADPSALSAVALRRAFMTFLMEWSHRTSPLSSGHISYSDTERRGAELFRDRCEGCHEARLASDVPGSRVPFASWEQYVFSPAAPIVWGQARYAKTGPAPYVHDEGARIPSLRRLYKKGPYFTTGAAKTLADLLARVRFDGDRFFHDRAPEDPALRSLAADEQTAIEAFLRLL